MRDIQRRPGRPTGERFPRRLPIYEDDEGMALLQEMARQDGCSAAALVRGLIRKEAAERGVAPAVVVRDPDRCGGNPILAGTRTAVHDVVSFFRIHQGDLGEVQAELPHLTVPQIEAALAYYQENADEIEAILRRRREFYERLPLAPIGKQDIPCP